jgi:hypothetical protein
MYSDGVQRLAIKLLFWVKSVCPDMENGASILCGDIHTLVNATVPVII